MTGREHLRRGPISFALFCTLRSKTCRVRHKATHAAVLSGTAVRSSCVMFSHPPIDVSTRIGVLPFHRPSKIVVLTDVGQELSAKISDDTSLALRGSTFGRLTGDEDAISLEAVPGGGCLFVTGWRHAGGIDALFCDRSWSCR